MEQITRYNNGAVKSIAHYNEQGQLDGPYTLYNKHGFRVIQTSYRNGLIHGKYELFSNDEQIIQESHLSEGKLIYK